MPVSRDDELWALFLAARAANYSVAKAAQDADEMLAEYRKRFPADRYEVKTNKYVVLSIPTGGYWNDAANGWGTPDRATRYDSATEANLAIVDKNLGPPHRVSVVLFN